MSAMIVRLKELYPQTIMIAIGFSMGGNIMLKYLGERKEHQSDFIGVMSACQGYDIIRYVTELTYTAS